MYHAEVFQFWLKEGYVTKKQAKPSQNKSNICGIVSVGISRMIKIKDYYRKKSIDTTWSTMRFMVLDHGVNVVLGPIF